ncbi:MAG: serine/threonine-protein kinase [Acidobacteria bacterium]|nr:serine/threonine-protein kinase [Acidobacteriota bacterium]
MVGKTISHYKVLEKIGQGGMGEVFLAQDTTLDRKVALKFLPEEMQQDSTAKKRFLREAKSAAALDHPYICHIHEVGEVEGKSFISMEYVQGTTLRERLTEGPLAVRKALETATEIAEALEEAHKQGIVHRDLKPSNIMLTPQGHVKVMDFGLAKQVTPVEGQEQEITTALTKQGSTLGTVPYMSPEQVRGQEVDTRSDIFSFGVVLYEMLTGVNPFKGDTSADTSHAILGETPPPLTRYTEDIPVLLQHIVKKMLAKESDRRYQLIHDVRTDLSELLRDIADLSTRQAGIDSFAATARETGAPVAARSWPQMVLWSIAVVVTLIAGISIWNLMRPGPLPLTKFVITPAANAPLANSLNTGVAISLDGRKIVYPAIVDGTTQLYVRDLDNLIATPLPGTEGAVQPFFSPDSRSVAFFTAGKLAKASLTGTPAVTLCDTPPGLRGGGSWGTEDTIVFAANNGRALYRVSARGGEPEVLLTPDLDKGESYWFPHILPGGKAVLFLVWDGGEGHQIAVVLLETGEKKILIEGGSQPYYASTGHLVYYRPFTGTLMAVRFEREGLEVIGEAIPVQEGIRTNTTGWADWAFSSNGTLVYVPGASDPECTLVWVDRKGQEEPLAAKLPLPTGPQLSPDGARLAITVTDSGNRDVWIYDLRRNTPTRLTFEPAFDFTPVWTPDGQRVVFRSSREGGQNNLFWKAADGTGQVERLTRSPNGQQPSSFSPDGKRLVFVEQSPETGFDLHVLSMEGEPTSQPLLQTPFTENRPVLSPDGHWIAYQSNESGQAEVYVRPFPNVEEGKWRISREGGFSPLWAPNGRELFYRSGDAMIGVTVETDPTFRAGSPKVLFTGEYYGLSYDISPDGQRFLLIKEAEQTEETATRTELIIVQNWFEELKRLVPTE